MVSAELILPSKHILHNITKLFDLIASRQLPIVRNWIVPIEDWSRLNISCEASVKPIFN